MTGAGGFVATYLINHCLECGDDVFASFRHKPPQEILNQLKKKISTFYYDILKPDEFPLILRDVKLDAVINLAGVSSLDKTLRAPEETLNINTFGAVELLRLLKKYQPRSRVLFVSSGGVYDSSLCPSNGFPETHQCAPSNLYLMTKYMMEKMVIYANNQCEMDIVIARPFNHFGPGQDERFVLPSFAAQIARMKISKSRRHILKVGNISIERDFLDVIDVVRAYRLLIEKGKKNNIYNISTGKSISLKNILDILREMSGIDFDIKIDPARERAEDPTILKGNPEKINRHTLWKAIIPLKDTLKKLYDDKVRLCR